MWEAIAASVLGNVVGGLMGEDSAEKAADVQAQSGADATGEIRRQFDLTRSDTSTARQVGDTALTTLAGRTGLAGPGASKTSGSLVDTSSGIPKPNAMLYSNDPAYRAAWDDFMSYHQRQYGRGLGETSDVATIEREIRARLPETSSAGMTPETAPLTRRFTMEDFQADPVNKASFEFGLSEGEKAVRRMFGANGLSRSGGAVKAATRFATDYAGQKAGESEGRFTSAQDREFAKMATLTGVGTNATNLTANAGASAANSIAGITTGVGNARGAATIAGGNAFGNAANNVANTVQRQFTMDDLYGAGRGSGSVTRAVNPAYQGSFDLNLA